MMQWIIIGVIGIVIFLILFLAFKKYTDALIYDFLDFALSTLDNFIGGFVGFNVGDILAALIIFYKEKKVVGWWAILPAIEAINLVVGMIPGIGQPIEWVTNFFPAVFISRLVFNKYGEEIKEKTKVLRELQLAKRLGINVSQHEKILKKVKKLIDKEDPVDALKKEKKIDQDISSKIIDYVNNVISQTNSILQRTKSKQVKAPKKIKDILTKGINRTNKLLKQAINAENQENYELAVQCATNARNEIITSLNKFENEFRKNNSPKR